MQLYTPGQADNKTLKQAFAGSGQNSKALHLSLATKRGSSWGRAPHSQFSFVELDMVLCSWQQLQRLPRS